MLDRARDADREIEFGRDDLARLADLVIVRRIARIDRGARRADGGTEFVGQGSISSWNLSDEPSARPPETMILADASSGRSLCASSAPSKRAFVGAAAVSATGSIVAVPPMVAALAKAVVRTVSTRFVSRVSTVAIAFPA